jgi:4-amino-4-deoxychorismate lyase
VTGVTASPLKLVAVLGVGLVEPTAPVLRADDLGAVRGDGCFEGCRIQTSADGQSAVDKLDAHLARMGRSAAGLQIPFDEPAWRELIDLACAAWTTPGEAALKLVLTRGAAGFVTGFLTITELSPDYARWRRDGLKVITLSRGTTSDAFSEAPWLLGGIKTLSSAVNMAAMREAERRGVDDVILVSVDGQVLESPTSSVLWTVGRTLHTIPTGANGILGGTTQHLLFEHASATGWSVIESPATVDDLHAADGLWLTSSVRGPIDIVELDGKARPRHLELDNEIRRLSGFPGR